MKTERVEKLQKKMTEMQIDAMVVTRDAEVTYLCGERFEEESTIILVGRDQQYIITDGRFRYQLEQNSNGFEAVIYEPSKGMYAQAHDLIRSHGWKKVVTEYEFISYGNYKKLAAEDIRIEDAPPILDEMRMVKDEEEILLIRKACAISDASFEAILGKLRPGMTELDVAAELEYEFKKRGGDGLAFDTIIASGPENGANCHATVSNRKLLMGDTITMDFGTTYEGYCSDITRTVVLGHASEEMKKVYGIVKEAKKRASDQLRDGAVLKKIAQTGVGYIEAQGYTVPHGIGHAFGLEIHEPLFISIRDDRCLKNNMITTIEPGIYIPGMGGIRIEDDYLIGPDGSEQLTHCDDSFTEI